MTPCGPLNVLTRVTGTVTRMIGFSMPIVAVVPFATVTVASGGVYAGAPQA